MTNIYLQDNALISPDEMDLPSYWETKQLKEVAKVRYGKARPRESGEIPVVGSGGVYGSTSRALVDFPTLIIGRKGTAGMVWLQEQPCWPSDTTFYLEWKTATLDYHFVYYVLLQRPLSGEHARTTLPSILRSDVEGYTIAFPPLPEQRAIVRALQAVQEAKTARQREMELERERKAALIEHLFTYGTRGESTKHTEIGEMPSSWTITTPEDLLNTKIISEIQDGNHGERHPIQSDFRRSGIPFLTADCVRGGKIDFHHAKYLDKSWLDRLRVGFSKPGDVLLTHKGTVGETSIVNERYDVVILSPQVTYYRIKDSKKFYPKYLFAVFQSPVFRGQLKRLASTQSTRAYVGITKQKKIRIPCPKFAEQVKIATTLLACDKKSAALDHERALLAELFQALLEELMTGRLLTKLLTETERNERKNRSAVCVN